MEIVIDADVIIAAEKGRFNLRDWLYTRAEDRPTVAAITVAEILHGVWRATPRHRDERRRFVEASLNWFSILPYNESTARVHARIWADLEMSGGMIDHYDLVVAATAIERNAAVATFNVKHFSRVEGLTIVEPALPGTIG